jgi:hypothetical protein
LIFLVFGRPELVEQQRLQLLGRAEVELVADGVVRVLRRGLDLVAQPGLQLDEVVDVGGDAGPLAVGQHRHQRQLEVAQQRGAAAPLEVGVQRDRQVGHRPGADREVGRAGVLLLAVEAELAVVAHLGAQLAAQEAQAQVGQVEDALPRQRQVGGQRGVAGQPGDRPAAGVQRQQRSLGVVHRLVDRAVGQPVPQRRLVVGVHRVQVDEGRVVRRRRGRAALERFGGDAGARPMPLASPLPLPQKPRTCTPTRTPTGSPPGSADLAGPSTRCSTAKPWSASGSTADRVAYSRSRRTRNCSASNTSCTCSRSHCRAAGRAGARPAARRAPAR